MLRLKNKVEGPSEVLDSTAHGPRFQNSKDVRGEPISSEADLTTALIKRLRDLETEMKSRNAVIQQLHIDKEKLEDK